MMADGLSPELLDQILAQAAASPSVRPALEAQAQRMLARARVLALKSGMPVFAASLHIEYGTRPGVKARRGHKRQYAEVVGIPVDGEHGTISPMQVLERCRNA